MDEAEFLLHHRKEADTQMNLKMAHKKSLPMLALMVFTLSAWKADSIVIEDTDFPASNWSQTFVIDTTPGGARGSGTAQELSGGNPGAFQLGVHDFGPGRLWIGHTFLNAPDIDPSSGPVEQLTFSFDFEVRFARFTSSPQLSVAPMVFQDGNFFVPSSGSNIAALNAGSGWQSFSFILSGIDFSIVDGSPTAPIQPDFSASGSTFSLGYMSINNTSITNNRKSWGVDNFRVDVNVDVPDIALPAGLPLALAGLLSLAWVGRRRS